MPAYPRLSLEEREAVELLVAEARAMRSNRDMLAQAVGVPLSEVPRSVCPTCGHERSVTRDATQPEGWRHYCDFCRKQRRRRAGMAATGSREHREKMRTLALADGRRPPLRRRRERPA